MNKVVLKNTPYPTEYRVEKFYPWYYDSRRPEPQGLPSTLSYGGNYFDVQLSKDDIKDGALALEKTKVVVIRTGFSTHAINFGQRMVQLENTYTLADDGSATLHVSQLPPNPNIMAPGPAWVFVVVDGVPSIGKYVLCGDGIIHDQPVKSAESLPVKSVPAGQSIPTVADTAGNPHATHGVESHAMTHRSAMSLIVAVSIALTVSLFAW